MRQRDDIRRRPAGVEQGLQRRGTRVPGMKDQEMGMFQRRREAARRASLDSPRISCGLARPCLRRSADLADSAHKGRRRRRARSPPLSLRRRLGSGSARRARPYRRRGFQRRGAGRPRRRRPRIVLPPSCRREALARGAPDSFSAHSPALADARRERGRGASLSQCRRGGR